MFEGPLLAFKSIKELSPCCYVPILSSSTLGVSDPVGFSCKEWKRYIATLKGSELDILQESDSFCDGHAQLLVHDAMIYAKLIDFILMNNGLKLGLKVAMTSLLLPQNSI